MNGLFFTAVFSNLGFLAIALAISVLTEWFTFYQVVASVFSNVFLSGNLALLLVDES
jgi:hypothetical protein